MNPFILDTKSRVEDWKKLRKDVSSEELVETKIQKTLQFWKQAPLENPLLDWDNSKDWPNPWELLHNNRFCESTLSLAVAYTLIMSDQIFSNITLILATDRKNHIQKIMVEYEDLIINYGWLDVNQRTILDNSHIHTRWKYDGKKWT